MKVYSKICFKGLKAFVKPLSLIAFFLVCAGHQAYGEIIQISSVTHTLTGQQVSFNILSAAMVNNPASGNAAVSENISQSTPTNSISVSGSDTIPITILAIDTTPPSISALELDGKEILENDFVDALPAITVTLTDNGVDDTGIASWNISIFDSSDTLVASDSDILTPTQNVVDAAFLVTTPLESGSYYVRVTAQDVSGNVASVDSPVFTVNTDFQLKDPLNGPNPFNPWQESTTIQYQLSEDADVQLYIYSISGEQLWYRHFSAGSPDGGSAGFNAIVWDGRSEYGDVVANGPYIAYLIAQSNGKRQVGKIKMMVLK